MYYVIFFFTQERKKSAAGAEKFELLEGHLIITTNILFVFQLRINNILTQKKTARTYVCLLKVKTSLEISVKAAISSGYFL